MDSAMEYWRSLYWIEVDKVAERDKRIAELEKQLEAMCDHFVRAANHAHP